MVNKNIFFMTIKQCLKNPLSYIMVIVTMLVLYNAFENYVDDFFQNKEEYEASIGYLSYSDFKEIDKSVILQETTGKDYILVYEDNMGPTDRENLYIKLEADFTNLHTLELVLLEYQNENKISNLKQLNAKELQMLSEEEYIKIKDSIFLLYPSGFSFLANTIEINGSLAVINIPYESIVSSIESKGELLSAPVMRFLVRITVTLFSFLTIFYVAMLNTENVFGNREKIFRISNMNVTSQYFSNMLGIVTSITILGIGTIFPVFCYVDSISNWGYQYIDFVQYFVVGFIISILFVALVTNLAVILSRNLIISILIPFFYTLVSAMGSGGMHIYPFGISLWKFIVTPIDMIWKRGVFEIYLIHQVMYLVIGVILASISISLWTRYVKRGYVYKEEVF